MDRDALELLLKQGLSLAEIGRRFGRDESTVGYRVKKHGLSAVNAEKHAGRGGLSREVLEELTEAGLSIRKIADRTGFSPTAVRHWLDQYGLATRVARRRADGRDAKADGLWDAEMECVIHGMTMFRLEGRGAYRCLRCRQERVTARRRDMKAILVEEAGGACVICGYDRCVSALQFHHLDRSIKSFALSKEGSSRSLAAMRAEASKCCLVCANCHAEIEAGVQTLGNVADRVIAG
jgi:transposase-like protein